MMNRIIFLKIQSDFYSIGSDIAKCEKDIEHSQKTESSRQKAIEEINLDVEKLNREISDNIQQSEEFDNKINVLTNELQELTIILEKLNHEKNDASFAVQNWQTKYNDFISTHLDTVKQLEVENTKIDASTKSLTLLNKRLNILESQNIDDENKEDKSEIIKQAKDIQEKLSSTLVDIDRVELKNHDNKIYKNIPNNIEKFLTLSKSFIIKFKHLSDHKQDEIKDIKIKIVDYEKIIDDSKQAINLIEDRINKDKKNKVKLEKQKVDFKQIEDSIAWKIDEKHQLENDLNMKLSAIDAERNSMLSNIDRMRLQIKNLEDKKLLMLSDNDSDELPATNMKSELSNLLDMKKQKEKQLGDSRSKLDSLDKEIISIDQQKNDLQQAVEDYKLKTDESKILFTEKNTQKTR